ncbi:MAG TPA: nuclear transport factor 2 family protein, partial [Steroidobacteraceae bacterium]|nr:nuclear transport factor 2 family protein [Steroidobacteraceae bacterium]
MTTSPPTPSASREPRGEAPEARLEREILRLEGVSTVKRLQRALGYYLDQAAWDEAADLFADDATIEVGLDGVYRGRERIRRYLYALGGGRRGLAQGELHECFQLQPLIKMSPDGCSAQARWRAFLMEGRLGERALWGEGPMQARYAIRDGAWRIESLHLYQTFLVPYEGGWLRNRDVTEAKLLSARLPPDAPPTEVYEPWPGVHMAAFDGPGPAETLSFPSSSDPAVAALEHRVLFLHDAAQIENLVSAYGYCLDKQQWDALAQLFAEDATMEISQRGVYVGRASIRRALELFGPQGIERGHVHNHMQMQPVIHISSDRRRAWVRSRAFSQLGAFQGGGIWHGGLYENELVNEDGVWRFRTDHVYTTYFAHYEQGWMTGPRPTPKPSDKIPPDRPATEVYESFPEVYIPPYHYRHPVTGRPIEIASGTTGATGAARAPAEYAFPADAGAQQPAAAVPVPEPLAGLAARVQRLDDERAIENLQRSYGFFVDKALWQATADLFTDEGTLEIGGRGVFAGKARVLEYLRWLEPKGLVRNKLFDHMQLQPIVTVAPDGASARGRWRFFAQVGEFGKSALWGLGTYEN